MTDLQQTAITALQISERLSYQGNLPAASIFSSVALAALQSQNLDHLRNKLSISIVSEAAETLMPLWEGAESGHQREAAAYQASFLAEVSSNTFLDHLKAIAPETLRRVNLLRAGGEGSHKAIKS